MKTTVEDLTKIALDSATEVGLEIHCAAKVTHYASAEGRAEAELNHAEATAHAALLLAATTTDAELKEECTRLLARIVDRVTVLKAQTDRSAGDE